MSIFKESKSKEQWIEQINELADAGVLTTGVTSQMVEDEVISKDRKKEIDAIIKGKAITSGTGSNKIKHKLPEAKPIKLSSKAIPTGSQSAVKAFETPTIKGSNQLPTMNQMGISNKVNIPRVKFSGLSAR